MQYLLTEEEYTKISGKKDINNELIEQKVKEFKQEFRNKLEKALQRCSPYDTGREIVERIGKVVREIEVPTVPTITKEP